MQTNLTLEAAQLLCEERAQARKVGDWSKADSIRTLLDEAGYQTQDHCNGTSSVVSIVN